jgi:hypothetical protein
MPPLPKVKSKARGHDISTEEHAAAVANVLAGKMQNGDRDRWATVTRVYFAKNTKARERFIAWYEEQ